MPWSASDAPRHTRKAKTPKAKRAFAYAANNVLRKTHDEGRAVRAGNAAAAKSARKSSRGKRRSQRK